MKFVKHRCQSDKERVWCRMVINKKDQIEMVSRCRKRRKLLKRTTSLSYHVSLSAPWDNIPVQVCSQGVTKLLRNRVV